MKTAELTGDSIDEKKLWLARAEAQQQLPSHLSQHFVYSYADPAALTTYRVVKANPIKLD